jgi:hypothetical protein
LPQTFPTAFRISRQACQRCIQRRRDGGIQATFRLRAKGLPGYKEFIGMGKTNLQTLDGPADMVRCEAGGRRGPCYEAQLTTPQKVHERRHLTPLHSEWFATEVEENAISIG